MANSKISALTAATTPLAGTEVLPIVQSSATVKVAANDLTVRNFRAAATTGILQVSGPSAASTRTMTVPDANFTAARTDSGQTFTGNQVITSSSTSILTVQTTGTSGQEVDIKVLATNSDASSNQWKLATNVAADNEFILYDLTNSTVVDRYIRGASGYRRLFVNGTAVANFSPAGDQTLYTGNLVIGTSGKGIDFSANTNASGMTSELLTWYEEGTWTPTVTFSTPGDLAVTYNTNQRQGIYTRIGNRVFIVFAVGTSSFTYTTASGNLQITGLPFAAKVDAGIQNIGSTVWGGITKAGYTQVVPRVNQNTSLIDFIASGSGVVQGNVTSADVLTTSTVVLRGTLIYEV